MRLWFLQKIGQTLPASFVGDEEEKMEPHQVGEEQEEEEQGPEIISCWWDVLGS